MISNKSLLMIKKHINSFKALVIYSSIFLGILPEIVFSTLNLSHNVRAEEISTSITIDSDVLEQLIGENGDLKLIKGDSKSSEVIIKAKNSESIDLSNLKFQSLNSLVLTTGSSLGGLITVELNESQINEIEKVSATSDDSLTINTSNSGYSALQGKIKGNNILINISNESNLINSISSSDESVANYSFISIPALEVKSNLLTRLDSAKNDVSSFLNLKNSLATNNDISSLHNSLIIARKRIKSNNNIKSNHFLKEKYNPAILHINWTFAKDKTIDKTKDAYLDITLILPENEIVGKRVELLTSNFTNNLRSLYDSLTSQNDLDINNPDSPSRKLYDLFLSSIDPVLKEHEITTLLISVDRGLQAVPFAALNDGKYFFGENYSYSITPSLSLTPLDYVSQSKGKLLALGAAKFKNLTNS